jgi:hypothetical protein
MSAGPSSWPRADDRGNERRIDAVGVGTPPERAAPALQATVGSQIVPCAATP